jgi:hypothetical protein
MFVYGSGQNEQSLEAILVSDWLISKKSSLTAWTNDPNLVGSIRERSSIKIAHLVPMIYKTLHMNPIKNLG